MNSPLQLLHKPTVICFIMDSHISVISAYFTLGLSHQDILFALSVNHGIVMSIRTLKRILHRAELYRRRNYSEIAVVVSFIDKEVRQNGGLFGYRWMYTKCLQHDLTVSRSVVSEIMQTLDAEGVALRRRRRLRRRRYSAKGPNFIWHMDGWDKLKPYGIAVHGCIDGFSRHIIWLEAHWTNNNPRLIGGYFTKAVTAVGGCPSVVRADNGTENGHVCAIQQYLRSSHTDAFSGVKSFLYGRSTANQRIEFLWGMLRKQCMQALMDVLSSLSEDGVFCGGDELDKAFIRFCFLDIIQKVLTDFMSTWDNHTVRRSNEHCPTGKPCVLYQLPALYGCEDYLSPVDDTDILLCADECVSKEELRDDDDLSELMRIVVNENGWTVPHDVASAVHLYRNLRAKIRPLLT